MMDPKDMEINTLTAKIQHLERMNSNLITGLYAITTVAGNLNDNCVMQVDNIEADKSRANMVVRAREIAVETLNKAGFEAGIKQR